MIETLHSLQRIQKIREQEARAEMVRAEAQLDQSQAKLAEVVARSAEARQAAEGSPEPDGLARAHAYTLRMEMARRRHAEEVERHRRALEERRAALVEASRTRRTTERMAELQQEALDEAEEAKDRARLDEVGLQAFVRRGS